MDLRKLARAALRTHFLVGSSPATGSLLAWVYLRNRMDFEIPRVTKTEYCYKHIFDKPYPCDPVEESKKMVGSKGVQIRATA